MKFRHRSLIILSGLTWLAIGLFLLTLGLRFIMDTLRDPALADLPGRFSMLNLIETFISDRQNSIVLLLTLGLLLGYIKGRTVLRKTVHRQVKRIFTLPNPASLKLLYTKGYYLLIALMILLGMSLRFIPITLDTRGVIDVAIGSALMNGAMHYFRSAANYKYLKKEGDIT